MSIDYDRLRDALTAIDNPKADKIARRNHTVSLRLRAPGTARELIRLHDGIERVLAQMNDHAATLRRLERHNVAFHMEQYAHLLTDLLDGDTE